MTFFCDPSLVQARDEQWSEVDLLLKMEELGLQVRPGFASFEEQAALVKELDEGPFQEAKVPDGSLGWSDSRISRD